jgi:8-amino-7-oxononanoate synthase
MKRRSSELRAVFDELDRAHLRRQRRTIDSFVEAGSRVTAVVDGRQLVDFSSNDYLGLARHPAVAAAMSECAERCGSGSGASHLVTGHAAEHTRLEEELAAFTGRERALLFSTGYMANLAVMTTLADRSETVLLDRLSHASLIDGGLLSGARFKRFAHADAGAAEAAMTDTTSVLATDGVFSMDGDMGPLADLARTAKAHDAWLVVDDAHGLGVIGANGRGAVEHFGLDADAVPVLVGTLGKAFGSFGAFVAGSAELIELLMQKARSYIYTTALPQPVAAASRKALEIAQRETWRRERVLALAAHFRQSAEHAGIPLLEAPPARTPGHATPAADCAPSASGGAVSQRTAAVNVGVRDSLSQVGGPHPASAHAASAHAASAHAATSRAAACDARAALQPLTPIQPVLLGNSEAALGAQRDLLAAGFCVVAIRPPTVPQGSARLRVTLSAAHTEAQVDELVETLSRVCAARNVVS